MHLLFHMSMVLCNIFHISCTCSDSSLQKFCFDHFEWLGSCLNLVNDIIPLNFEKLITEYTIRSTTPSHTFRIVINNMPQES